MNTPAAAQPERVHGFDLYADGFPHGSKDGYSRGCRDTHCPNLLDGGLSCRQAWTRYNGDYAYRKAVDRGDTPEQIAAMDQAALAAGRVKTVAKPKPEDPEPTPAGFEVFKPKAKKPPATAPVNVDPPARVVPPEKHGTLRGYHAGCRLKDECPGIQTVGLSCNQALNAYQRGRKAIAKPALAPQTVDQDTVTPAPAGGPDVDDEMREDEATPTAEDSSRIDPPAERDELQAIVLSLVDSLAQGTATIEDAATEITLGAQALEDERHAVLRLTAENDALRARSDALLLLANPGPAPSMALTINGVTVTVALSEAREPKALSFHLEGLEIVGDAVSVAELQIDVEPR
ncbi:MAG: hypothetical protein ABJB33_06095 [Gemmatimonadota bacterium]